MPTKIDDKTFEDFGFREVVGHRNPSTPEFTERTVVIPKMAGVWSFGHQIGTRTFEIPLKHLYNDMYKRQRFLNELVAFLFDDYGQPREFKLFFEYEPDKYYKVKISGQINPERLIYSNTFTLTLKANDPYKHFVNTMDDITWGSDISFMSDITFGGKEAFYEILGPQIIQLDNQGTLSQKLSMQIVGKGQDVKFTLGSKSFSLGSFSNTTYVIDGEKYSVYKNGVENLSAMDGDFLTMATGNNALNISGSSLNFTLTITNHYKYK